MNHLRQVHISLASKLQSFWSWKESNRTSVKFSDVITHWYPLSSQPKVCVVLLSQAPSKGKAGADIMFKFASQSLKFTSYRMQTKHVTEQLEPFLDQETAKILSQLCECNKYRNEFPGLIMVYSVHINPDMHSHMHHPLPQKRNLGPRQWPSTSSSTLSYCCLMTFFKFSFTFSFSWYFLSYPPSSVSPKHYPA